MSEHDFNPLFDQYSIIIEQMPETFTSHEFILTLAQENQALYVEALHTYRHGKPFQTVHGILAKRLHQHPDLITYVDEVTSRDIFGHANPSARWRKT